MKNIADIYALSPMQHLMLLHAKTTSRAHDVLFNQIVYELNGVLDVAAYRRAWQLMVDRHAALRTIFVWQDGKDPVQVVREQASLPCSNHDWRERPADEQASALDQLLAADRAQGFDMLQAPLMRLHLLRTEDEKHWLVWSSHHLIIDRWCIEIILQELGSAYEAYASGTSPALAPAPRYSDYVAWLAKQDKDKARSFWRETLHDVQARPLPLQKERGDAAPDLDTVQASIAAVDWANLRRFALDNNVTSSTLISAAWAIVLGAATGAADALFGLTVSGRPAELANVGRTVGCFINNVPLRVRLDGEQPLVVWLQDLQDRQLSLQPYEYASPAQIQAWSGLQTKGPLFDTLLVLQAPVELPEPAGLAVAYAGGGMQTGYPVSLGAVPGQDKLRLTLTYDRRLVPQALSEQMVSVLQAVLLAMPAHQNRPLHDVRTRIQIDTLERPPPRVSGPAARPARTFTPSRLGTEETLAKIWSEVLNVPDVGSHDTFADLGGDSIQSLQLLTNIEQRMGVSLPVTVLFRNPTVAQMARAIDEETEEHPRDPVLVPITTGGTRPPLFFTHGVYGGLLWLKNLAPLLEADQPAYGVQAVGLQPDTEPDLSIEAMAARYAAAIQRVQASGPYHLAGFCFGGVLAYEIARQLEQSGERTALLAIIDGFPAQLSHRKRSLLDPIRLRAIRRSAPYWIHYYRNKSDWNWRERILSRLGLDSNGHVYADRGVGYDDLGDFIASTRETQLQITKINQRAAEKYVPQAYGGQVTLFLAQLLGVRHALLGPVDPQRGWGRLAGDGVAIRPVRGTHVGMLTPPHVSDLARQLNDALQSAMKASQEQGGNLPADSGP